MPLIQGGPPEWIWERTPDPMKVELVPSQSLEGHTVYEVRVQCGLEILRLQFFSEEELRAFESVTGGRLPQLSGKE